MDLNVLVTTPKWAIICQNNNIEDLITLNFTTDMPTVKSLIHNRTLGIIPDNNKTTILNNIKKLNPNLDTETVKINFITNKRAIIYGENLGTIPVFLINNVYRPATNKEIAANNKNIINIKLLNRVKVKFQLNNNNDNSGVTYFLDKI